MQRKMALVLSGGGARGAFQAGVVRALFEISKEAGHMNLFRIVTGVSAGSINAAFLATQADDLDGATARLCDLWRKLQAEDVFRTDYTSVTRSALKLVRGVSLGGISDKLRPVSTGLLNTEPLRQTLAEVLSFAKIGENLMNDRLDAVSVSATDYSTSVGVSFVQGRKDFTPWKSANRTSAFTTLTVDHIMASSAIPLFFSPISVDGRAYGDGCLRNTAPLSPAVHLGGERLVVVGVRRTHDIDLSSAPNLAPSLGRVLSVLINAIFMDAVEVDLERLRIINQTVDQLRQAGLHSPYRPIEALYICPSEGLSDIAQTRNDELPKIIRFLLAGLGTPEEAAEILSYLLFEPGYCGSLVDLGYKDTMSRRAEILAYLNS
ncbi:MAG: patatin-like phospholipase family protein [Bdellovibrionales bacterium]